MNDYSHHSESEAQTPRISTPSSPKLPFAHNPSSNGAHSTADSRKGGSSNASSSSSFSRTNSSSPAPSSGSAPYQPRFVPQLLAAMGAWAWRILVIAAAIALIVWVLIKLSPLIIALLVSLLLAVVTEPLNSALHKKLHWPRAAAAGATVILLLLILAGLIAGAGTGIYQGFYTLAHNITTGLHTVTQWLYTTFPALESTSLSATFNHVSGILTGNTSIILGGIVNAGTSITTFFAGFVLAFFALFFFLKDGRRIWHWFLLLLPRTWRNNANEAGIRAWVTLGNYARIQAIVALADALGIALFAACLKTPPAIVIPIALLVFLGAFIPIVGALLSGSVAVLVVLVNTSSFMMAFIMLCGVLLVQQMESHVLQPLLQGNALNMHALAIVLLVTGGTVIAGAAGALFTVPLAAAINSMILYLRGHDIFPYLTTMPDRPGGPHQDFSIYAREYWDEFDRKIAQHVSPKEARRQARKDRARRRRQRHTHTPHSPAPSSPSPHTHLTHLESGTEPDPNAQPE